MENVVQKAGTAGHQTRLRDEMRLWMGRSMRVVLPMLCSVALLWWLFSKVDFREMMDILRHHVNYWWILLMMGVNTMSYVIRGIRWGLQLDEVGIHVNRNALCASIYGAYALNLVFAGFGEAWRCIYISRRNKAPLSTVIGTDIGDRISDAIVVIGILVFTWLFADGSIAAFMRKYAVGRDVVRFADNPWLWAIIIAVVFGFWSGCHYLKRFQVVQELDACLSNIWDGFKVLFTMHRKGQYALLTLGIWICYFLQTYLCFFAFPFTKELLSPQLHYGLVPGMVVLLFGSLSMAIPSSGGLGPWNLAVMFALSLYGISDTYGAAFAMLVWSAQALTEVVLGIYTMAYVGHDSKTAQICSVASGSKAV